VRLSPLERSVDQERARTELPWRQSTVRALAVTLGILVVLAAIVGLFDPSVTARAAMALLAEVALAAGTVWASRGLTAAAGWQVVGWTNVSWSDVRRGGLWFLLQQAAAIAFLIALLAAAPNANLRGSSNLSDLRHAAPLTLILLAIPAVLVAPFVEELMFRGVLLRAFMQRMPFGGAAAISSLIFALLHVPQVHTATGALILAGRLFIFAYLQCLLVRETNRLAPAVVVHAAANLLAVVLLAAGA
jgi:membrane protease YdiL (CAAX protease family)